MKAANNRYWLKQPTQKHLICFTEQEGEMVIVEREFDLSFFISKVMTKEDARAYYSERIAEGWQKVSGTEVPAYCEYKCGVQK